MSYNNLHKAKTKKNNEFYTLLTDIEKELDYYKEQFIGKIIYCNCDNPDWSKFYKYFKDNFNILNLKCLISTYYSETEQVYKTTFNGTLETREILLGNGDFASTECIDMLNQCDIVVSNPPFSLARLYLDVLINSGKQFLFICNKNAITYKEFFKNIKENKLWLGYTSPEGFTQPEGAEIKQMAGLCKWFTNMDTNKRHEDLFLYKTYNETDYPKFDNYDAINCDKTKDIPMDYFGCIGVPITFLDKFSPEQFEILGCTYSYGEPIGYHIEGTGFNPSLGGKEIYKRLFIKRKQ